MRAERGENIPKALLTGSLSRICTSFGVRGMSGNINLPYSLDHGKFLFDWGTLDHYGLL